MGAWRSNKQLAVYTKSTVSLEMVDTVFLNCGQGESPLSETLQSETIKNVQQHVAAIDKRAGNELLKQIRQHSSPMAMGDAMQRLAPYFAHGLEARMAGSGTQIYKDLLSKPASDCLWFSMALHHSTSLV
ncbi:hypothetical protein ACFX19_001395 [Malus domestica]